MAIVIQGRIADVLGLDFLGCQLSSFMDVKFGIFCSQLFLYVLGYLLSSLTDVLCDGFW